MASQKQQRWTAEEEKALRDGVAKHGVGKWKIILDDPEFASSFINRSNINLKDKWRNFDTAASSSSTIRYKELWHKMVFESLSSTDNAEGLDIDGIQSYFAESDAPKPRRRYLRTMLWRLVTKGKLEKNENRYKIKQPNNPNDGGNDEQQIETQEDAAAYAAHRIAIAEEKKREMIEAIQEENRIAKILEENEAMLALANEIYERCKRDGVVYLRLPGDED